MIRRAFVFAAISLRKRCRKGDLSAVSARTQNLAMIAAAFAGIAGACGVGLAAAGAHVSASPLLTTAADFLLIHAVAALALAGLALASPRRGGWFLCAAALLLLGGFLFCGDLSFRALAGARLFPMAAPIGGSLLILGWIAGAVAAVAALWRGQR
jgi:uncharacterized membrane protein YgdD (TMEM256/DUF423 family)